MVRPKSASGRTESCCCHGRFEAGRGSLLAAVQLELRTFSSSTCIRTLNGCRHIQIKTITLLYAETRRRVRKKVFAHHGLTVDQALNCYQSKLNRRNNQNLQAALVALSRTGNRKGEEGETLAARDLQRREKERHYIHWNDWIAKQCAAVPRSNPELFEDMTGSLGVHVPIDVRWDDLDTRQKDEVSSKFQVLTTDRAGNQEYTDATNSRMRNRHFASGFRAKIAVRSHPRITSESSQVARPTDT
eukprot:755564-Amphidinium_carterae.1